MGLPGSLPDYPYGSLTETISYRSIITGTTAAEMKDYVDTRKRRGYIYTDLYDLGFSEADMLYFDGWQSAGGRQYSASAFKPVRSP